MKKYSTFFRKFSIFLTICLFFCCGFYSPVQASTKSSPKEFLLDAGTPETILDTLPEEQINRMYKNLTSSGADVTYAGKTTIPEQITLRGNINTNDLDFSALYYNLSYEGKVFQVQLYMNYRWKTLPNVAKTDALIVSWDKNLFTLANAGIHCFADTFVGKITCKDQYNPDVTAKNALGFYLPLSDASLWGATSYYGSVDVFLNTPETLSPNESCNINLKYTHLNNANENINLTVNGTQINVSGTTSIDTLQKNISYKANNNIIEE